MEHRPKEGDEMKVKASKQEHESKRVDVKVRCNQLVLIISYEDGYAEYAIEDDLWDDFS
jgi:hypothetical protein